MVTHFLVFSDPRCREDQEKGPHVHKCLCLIHDFSSNLSCVYRNDSPEDRTFRLKFLDELPDSVWTGTVLISKENKHLKMALHNSEGRIVKRGPGSSAKVDVVLLEVNDNDDESNISEIFESRTIKTGEKKKPHFAKDVHIYLEEGVGILTGVKFGHGSDWVKKYKYRLGAKMGQNLNGVMVQEAWTPPFEVKDKRIKSKFSLLTH